ncbi:MAG: hypothetical protein P8171_22725 [Candidatus Thiodiazotropha sp.]
MASNIRNNCSLTRFFETGEQYLDPVLQRGVPADRFALGAARAAVGALFADRDRRLGVGIDAGLEELAQAVAAQFVELGVGADAKGAVLSDTVCLQGTKRLTYHLIGC